MPSYVAGNLALRTYIVLDLSDNPLTGMLVPADVTLTLFRQSGTTMVAASESMSWAEVGTTGTYYVGFTPTQSGQYVLYLREIDPLTAGRQQLFEYEVLAAGAQFTPSYANAFCAETDVERYLLQSIDPTTKPNDTQVAGWAQGRADTLESLCARYGFTVTPATVTAGSRLEGMLREANAVGAALDATIAQVFGTGTSKTEKAEALQELWDRYYGVYVSGEWQSGLIGLEVEGNVATLASSHVISGDTTARANEGSPQDIGFDGGGIRMSDVF